MARDSALERLHEGSFESKKAEPYSKDTTKKGTADQQVKKIINAYRESEQEKEPQGIGFGGITTGLFGILIILVMISVFSIVVDNVLSISGLSTSPFFDLSGLLPSVMFVLIIIGVMAAVTMGITRG